MDEYRQTTVRVRGEHLERLRNMAKALGFVDKGQGNLSGLLTAIAVGEITLTPRADTPLSSADRSVALTAIGAIERQLQFLKGELGNGNG